MDARISTFVRPRSHERHPYTERALGLGWIKQALQEVAKPMSLGKKGFDRTYAGLVNARLGHPLIWELYEAGLGRRTRLLRMDLIEDCLSELSLGLLDGVTLRSRLRSSSEYAKVEFELLVAAAHARHGCEIHPNLGSAGSDLIVKAGSSDQTWVECKRKDTRTELETRMVNYRRDVDDRLVRGLQDEKLCYHINFHVLDDPSAIDASDLIRLAISLCKTRDMGSEVISDRIRIEVLKLAEPGTELPAEVLNMLLTQRAGMRSGQAHVIDGQPDLNRRVDPVQVQWYLPKDVTGRAKSIETTIHEAASQIPQSGPGIVYIDVSSNDYYKTQESLAELDPVVEEALSRHYTRLNYVVLTAICPSSTSDGIEGWSFETLLVEQRRPRTHLPDKMPVLGRTPHFERCWIVGPWLHDRYQQTASLVI